VGRVLTQSNCFGNDDELEEEKGTFYVLCRDQRLFTPVVLGIIALELLFEFRIGFTPEDR